MAEEKRPDWMSNISSLVDPDEYLLGRKIDKTFELSQKEKADKAREARIELLAKDKIKLSHDPILDLERRKQQLKMELINNPVMMKQFREKLLKGEHGSERNPSGDGDSRGNRDQRSDRNPGDDYRSGRDSSRDHSSNRGSNIDRDHRSNRHTSGDHVLSRDRDRDRHNHNDLRTRHDKYHHRSGRDGREDRRSPDSGLSQADIDKAQRLSSNISNPRYRKGKVHVQGSKPEMPAFLQRIKEQVVANEDNDRKLRAEKKRRERSGRPTNEEDDPTVVKLGDDDLTEAEYKRLKRDLETQYKIPDEKACEKRVSEDLDIDQFIKSDRSSLSRGDQRPSTSRSHDNKSSHSSKDSRGRSSTDHESSKDKTSSGHRKVLSYGSSSDDND